MRSLLILLCQCAVSLTFASAHQNRSNDVSGTVLARLNGFISDRSVSDEVSIIREKGGLYLVFETRDSNTTKIAREPLPGTALWSTEHSLGLQLRDITGDGRNCVVVISTDGASSGAYLRVFNFEGHSLRLISPSDAGGYDFGFKPSPSGKGEEIIAYGKWTEEPLTQVNVLVWNGNMLVLDAQAAASIAREKMNGLIEEVINPAPMPPLARVARAQTPFDWMIRNKAYTEALSFATSLLAIIGTNNSNLPNVRPAKEMEGLNAEQRTSLAEAEQTQALSAVHGMLSKTYGLLGEEKMRAEEQAITLKLGADASAKTAAALHEIRHP